MQGIIGGSTLPSSSVVSVTCTDGIVTRRFHHLHMKQLPKTQEELDLAYDALAIRFEECLDLDGDIASGKVCLKGTRSAVSDILKELAQGDSSLSLLALDRDWNFSQAREAIILVAEMFDLLSTAETLGLKV